MPIWSAEIKELERLFESFKGQLPDLEKELGRLIKADDENMILLYSRRCLEVIIIDLCECELKRQRGTEPLKGIIDKLHKERKVPDYISTSMHGLNDLSTYGAHPKDFDPEQVKPTLNNLDIIIKWYLKYKETGKDTLTKPLAEIRQEIKSSEDVKKGITISRKRLAGMLGGLTGIIASVLAVLYFSNIIGGGKQSNEIEKSIAVLPFKNESLNDSTTFFIDGVMEEILSNLQTIKDMRVISRTSVEQYRNTTKSIPEIAKELGVNYVVEGSGQKYGKTFRLRVQLIRAVKESHLWAKPYEQEIKDAKVIFKIQSQVAEAIAAELEAVITPREKRIIDKIPTSNLTAYEAYLKGISHMNKFNEQDWEVALKYFEEAKEKDPGYALAYCGICEIWINRALFSSASPEVAAPKAIAAFTKALELDSMVAEVYNCLSNIQSYIRYDWKGAELSSKKAIALNPNNANAHTTYAFHLIIMGRMDEAIIHNELALKLDPLNPTTKAVYGLTLLFAHMYDDAIRTFQEVLKMDPAHMLALGNLPEAFHQTGRYKEELEAWESYFSLSFKDFIHVFDQGYAKGGYTGALELEADTLVAQSKTNFINPFEIALLYACAGNKVRTMDMLELDYEMQDLNLPFIINYPVLDNLHNEPRFQNLCRRMNLPFK
jgi:TolB-like protein/Tfp pilus assembly protein PilF